ncbi:hypothetical protein [Rhodococcus qingshengii]|uniref:hypothetical protein n=1 Tax=Rhodococcus qingshengii TaxID=334542 RepID=UPI00237D0326|nr:hypothetical protein [Rhodococcus qingshengii]WCT05890.1 hypothetical protein PI247_30970 [Rhodococcus qingshengii]
MKPKKGHLVASAGLASVLLLSGCTETVSGAPIAATVAAATSTEYKTTLTPLPGVDYQRFEWPGTDTRILMPLVDGWQFLSNLDEETDDAEGPVLSNLTGLPEGSVATGAIAFDNWEKKYAKDEEQATVQAYQSLTRLNDFTLVEKKKTNASGWDATVGTATWTLKDPGVDPLHLSMTFAIYSRMEGGRAKSFTIMAQDDRGDIQQVQDYKLKFVTTPLFQ